MSKTVTQSFRLIPSDIPAQHFVTSPCHSGNVIFPAHSVDGIRHVVSDHMVDRWKGGDAFYSKGDVSDSCENDPQLLNDLRISGWLKPLGFHRSSNNKDKIIPGATEGRG